MDRSSKMQGRHVHYSGRVQGVGFRYTVRSIAERYEVSGFVRNLPDGRVELVVEGSPEELERFLADIDQRMEGYIRDIQSEPAVVTGKFVGFSIRY